MAKAEKEQHQGNAIRKMADKGEEQMSAMQYGESVEHTTTLSEVLDVLQTSEQPLKAAVSYINSFPLQASESALCCLFTWIMQDKTASAELKERAEAVMSAVMENLD